jgi:hypothetical protein
VVFVDQTAEYLFTVDPRSGVDGLIRGVVRWQLLAALAWAVIVVVGLELSENPVQVPVPQDEQVIQALTAHGADEPLRVGVRARSLDRGLDDPNAA